MKTVISLLILSLFLTVFFFIPPVFSEHQPSYSPATTDTKEEAKPEIWCPATKISDNDKCMSCHRMRKDTAGKAYFGLRELPLDANYSEVPYNVKIISEDQQLVPYVNIDGTNSEKFWDAAQYIFWHPEFKKVVIEIHSPGGSVMDAWRSVGIVQEMQKRGILVETRCYGLSASAAVLLLASGDIGHRYVSPHSEIMMHKVWTFKMFAIATPDSAEDQAATLKHFQENLNSFLISRSKLTKEKIEEFIFKKDFWFTGEKAIELGLADKFIGE